MTEFDDESHTTGARGSVRRSTRVSGRRGRVETKWVLRPEDLAPPQIFISSTFEPLLADIRTGLKSDLEDLGYLPLMSELGGFVYRAGAAPVYDDTVTAVAGSQIYVLVIGRRYGTTHPRLRKSITELEYDAARRRGLPTYVFVHAPIFEGLLAWRAGSVAKGKHTHWVDDVRVWRFLDRITDEDACPIFRFAQSDVILGVLHQQLANLFGAYLRFDLKAKGWLWSEERTREVEGQAREVWVLTPNFFWDYHDTEFRELVLGNVVQRGAKYRYLYRSTADNAERVAEMSRDYEEAMGDAWREQVKYFPVPEAEFVWCTEQIIFDPGTSQERGILVDAMDSRDKSKKYNVELGREKRSDLKRQFDALWRKYGEPTE